MRGIVLAALGGFALVLAFPPFGLWPLIFVGFVPIVVAEHRILPASWSGTGLTTGIGIYIAVQAWGGLQASQRWLLLVLVPVLWLSGRLDAALQRSTAYRHVWWSSAVMWTAGLFLFGLTPIASWLDPAFALYREPWLIQPVSVLSVSGLNLFILIVNYLLAAAILVPESRTRRWALVSAGLVSAIWVACSVALLGAGRAGPSVRVAVVEPGAIAVVHGTPGPATSATQQSVLAQLIAGSRQAASRGAQVVVWPEKVLTYDPRASSAVQTLVKSANIYLVIGYTPDAQRFNRATVLAPSGQFLDVYNKQHPVRFQGDHSTGGPVVVADMVLARVAPIICYDLDYQNTARAAARHGAQLLAVPSEDWPGIAEQHYTHLVFRAVENRLAAAKADTAWDSAIIDPNGRIVRSHVSRREQRSVLVATVPLGTGHSPFTVTGNWLGWLTVAMSGVWALIGVRITRRAHGATYASPGTDATSRASTTA